MIDPACERSVLGINRFRTLIVFLCLFCLLGVATAVLVISITRGASASSGPPENAYVAPGITVQTDASGDHTGAPADSQSDLTSVQIAEPYVSDIDQSIIFTPKVNNLSGGPQANSTWVAFTNIAEKKNTQTQRLPPHAQCKILQVSTYLLPAHRDSNEQSHRLLRE